MLVAILIFVLISIFLSGSCLYLFSKNKGKNVLEEQDKRELKDSFSSNVKIISDSLSRSNDRTADVLKEKLESMDKSLKTISENTNANLEQMRRAQSDEFTRIRSTLQENIRTLQENN